MLDSETNLQKNLTKEDYDTSPTAEAGELKTLDADLTLVTGAATRAEEYIAQKQWALLWRDSDLLYQSPRPMSVYENTYVLEPNVQRFTVAKTVQSIVPQLYKGLFYQDPPMILRPRPGTSQAIIDAKTSMFSYMFDSCNFRTETKWGLEQMAFLGTTIFKWGIEYKTVITERRIAQKVELDPGKIAADAGAQTDIPSDKPPKIDMSERTVPRPFFESRPIDRVLVDPKLENGDIRNAAYVIDVRYMNYYQFEELKHGIDNMDNDDPEKAEWMLPKGEMGHEELMNWWLDEPDATPYVLTTEQASTALGAVMHAERQNISVTPDRLMMPKEVLEYWDNGKKIVVVARKKVIFKGKNRFGVVPFLSANWWNRPRAFYGMGLGLIVGQNQRVDQGTINSILKLLSFGVNPLYLKRRDANNLTQMVRTGLGRIWSVDVAPGESVEKAVRLMETPQVPSQIWQALAESEKNTESTSGADAQLVQGSSAGPRSSMGRTAGGANLLAGASATRLDGPLDNFIEQVFKPFLYIMDRLIFKYISDAEIMNVLGEEFGKDYKMDMQEYHDTKMEYEVLAGSSLAAKRTMAQSMTLITQIFENPQINQYLADNEEEYIDYKVILEMWLEASEWKNKNDIIKKMTPDMKKRRDQAAQAAQQQSKAAMAMQLSDRKAQQKSELSRQQAQERIQKDIVINAFRTNAMSEATSGTPSAGGLGGETPEVQ